MSILLSIFQITLLISGTFCTLIGLLTIVQLFIRSKKSPADSSNRIGHMRLWWFALTRPELFTSLFPWLKNDELDNFPKD
jgi:hypothetical protein